MILSVFVPNDHMFWKLKKKLRENFSENKKKKYFNKLKNYLENIFFKDL